MPLGSSSAAPVTIPGPSFERMRKIFGHHESSVRGSNFGESLRTAHLRSGISAIKSILRLTDPVLQRTMPICANPCDEETRRIKVGFASHPSSANKRRLRAYTSGKATHPVFSGEHSVCFFPAYGIKSSYLPRCNFE
jgi:hypothetical protein